MAAPLPRRYRFQVQKALAVLAGPLFAVWLFLVVIAPLVAVVLMLTAVTWRAHRRRRAAAPAPAVRVRFLRMHS
jgi:hypothetical protein